MLSQANLVSMTRALQDERVLSTYVDGTERDPAVRDAWRVKVDALLKDCRRAVEGETHAEREELQRAIGFLDERLATFNGAVGAPGLVLFVTANGVAYEEALPVPMPTAVTWRRGPAIAPYARALKEQRSVILLLLDTRKASLFHYREGAMAHVGTLTVHTSASERSHMGDAPRMGFHAGVRGSTGRDETQRVERAGVSRLMRSACDRAMQLAGDDGWILVAGLPTARARASALLVEEAPRRVLQLSSLTPHAPVAAVADAARAGASELRDERDLGTIAELIAEAGANATVALGADQVRDALVLGAVRELYLTPAFVGIHADAAESAVRSALQQGAEVEEVSRGVAGRLDEFGGVAARLRFAVRHEEEVEPPLAAVGQRQTNVATEPAGKS